MIDITRSEMNRFSYCDWYKYFARNDGQRLEIDFSQERKLSADERRLIFPSIQAFQQGEASDGKYLMKTVEEFIQKTDNQEYKKAMRYFIREENWHSAYLKKYMDYHNVVAKKKSFLDGVFRRLRRLGGLKCEVTILVTAEIIALTYYDALSKCIYSPALKSICGQMLSDEIPHIMFQSYTLSHFPNGAASSLFRKMVMTVTSLFVWMMYRKVFITGGYGLRGFLGNNLSYLKQSQELVRLQVNNKREQAA